jgi:uncharacterized glyoxalase superfamily protein PhnB
MDSEELFSHCASILPVTEMERSLHFYEKQLGFKINFTWNDPVEYAVLKRGEVSIHLSKIGDCAEQTLERSMVYIFVYDVDLVYQEFLQKKVLINTPPADQPYQMREFHLSDPDGHMLSFGKGLG